MLINTASAFRKAYYANMDVLSAKPNLLMPNDLNINQNNPNNQPTLAYE